MKSQYPPNKVIDFLCLDAEVRLRFERLRKNKQPKEDDSAVIDFVPLAAAGAFLPTETSCFSQDHNFKVFFRHVEPDCLCQLQAQGHAAIELVRNRAIKLCFAKQYFFLAKFNDEGCAHLSLPKTAPNGEHWQKLAFTLLV